MKNSTLCRLLEPEIKAITLNYMLDKAQLIQGQIVINEFTLKSYSRRVDLLFTTQKHLIAVEVKSEADSLQRLSGQTSKYLEYFDKVIIVAASKHIQNIIRTVPKNVEIWEVCNGHIRIKQRGKIVPITNKAKLLDLMKANELLKLSSKLGLSTPSKNRRSAEKVLKKAPVNKLRQAVLENLAQRFSMTCSLFWQGIKNKEVSSKHIELLSPYKEKRLSLKAAKKEKELFWDSFFLSKDDDYYFREMTKKENKQIFGKPPKHIRQLMTA